VWLYRGALGDRVFRRSCAAGDERGASQQEDRDSRAGHL